MGQISMSFGLQNFCRQIATISRKQCVHFTYGYTRTSASDVLWVQFLIHEATYLIHEAKCLINEATYLIHEAKCLINEAKYLIHEVIYLIHEAIYLYREAIYLAHEAIYLIHEANYLSHEAYYSIHEANINYFFNLATSRSLHK
jgi:hypothetical protein